jgi:hypothetical protein
VPPLSFRWNSQTSSGMVRVGLRRPSASLSAHVISSWQCVQSSSPRRRTGGLAEDLQCTPGGRGFGCRRAVWRPADGHAPDHVGGGAQVELLEAAACLARELARWRQERRVRRPVRISLTRISGCSKAAKCPPLSASP